MTVSGGGDKLFKEIDSLYICCAISMIVNLYTWAPKVDGRGRRIPAVEKSEGDILPRNLDISVTFCSIRMKILHVPAFS